MEKKKLCKSDSDKAILGVCGGIARYTGIDSLVVRLSFVLLALLVGLGIILYIVLALVMHGNAQKAQALSPGEVYQASKNAVAEELEPAACDAQPESEDAQINSQTAQIVEAEPSDHVIIEKTADFAEEDIRRKQMRKPIIGVCVTVNRKGDMANKIFMNSNYTRGIEAGGGVPMIIPVQSDDISMAEDYINAVDGLLIQGGVDVSPRLYGEDPCPSVKYCDVALDNMEIALIRLAKEKGIPVFGICRGMQIMNVALGGNMYQDIPSQVKSPICHAQDQGTRNELTHQVFLEAGTEIAAALGTEEKLYTNSFHHQAVKDLAPGFVCAAKAADGIVEAMEDTQHKLYAVQWHPEELFARYDRFTALFKILGDAAAEYANK